MNEIKGNKSKWVVILSATSTYYKTISTLSLISSGVNNSDDPEFKATKFENIRRTIPKCLHITKKFRDFSWSISNEIQKSTN